MEQARQFLEAAKQAGASDEFVFRLLREQGWPESEILSWFREHYERKTGVPLPARRAGVTARSAFLLLLSFATLTTWALAVGGLIFRAIDVQWPDPLETVVQSSDRYRISQNLASVLVAFPLYVFVMRLIHREEAAHPETRESGVRRWLTYIALLFAAGTVIGDLVTFLAFLFRGELTIRFVLKVLTVLVMAGGVLRYYLGFVRGETRLGRAFLPAAAALVAAAVVWGGAQLGPPVQQRSLRADEERVLHLRALESNLSGGVLPESLEPLAQRGLALRDPITRAPYEYRRTGERAYMLCATFDRPGGDEFWTHPAGTHCYSFRQR